MGDQLCEHEPREDIGGRRNGTTTYKSGATNMGDIWGKFVQLWGGIDKAWVELGQTWGPFGLIWGNVGQIGLGSALSGVKSMDVWASSACIGGSSANGSHSRRLDHTWAELDEIGFTPSDVKEQRCIGAV